MKYIVNHMTLSIDNGTFTLCLTKKKQSFEEKKHLRMYII